MSLGDEVLEFDKFQAIVEQCIPAISFIIILAEKLGVSQF